MIEIMIKEFIAIRFQQQVENEEAMLHLEQSIDSPKHISEFNQAGMNFHMKIALVMERRKMDIAGKIDEEIERQFGKDLSIEEKANVFDELASRVLQQMLG